MSSSNQTVKHNYTTEIPVAVPLAFIEFLKACRESTENLMTKHLENESQRLRTREIEARTALQPNQRKDKNAS